jgi:hypothetical protein
VTGDSIPDVVGRLNPGPREPGNDVTMLVDFATALGACQQVNFNIASLVGLDGIEGVGAEKFLNVGVIHGASPTASGSRA